jgi:hypothetical protein
MDRARWQEVLTQLQQIRPTLSSELLFSWNSQACQYPAEGPAGVSYFRGNVSEVLWVDCLLYRNEAGQLLGILNHYPLDWPPFEKAGNINIWVCPEHLQQGIGTALLTEAFRRWPINLLQQRYTVAGLQFVRRFVEREMNEQGDRDGVLRGGECPVPLDG